MSSGGQYGTSRGDFLKQAAGAAAVVAGAGAGAAGVFAQSAAAADQRAFTAGRFAAIVDGDSAGMLAGMSGGDVEYGVVDDPVGVDNIQRKHIGNIQWSDCTVQVGSGMSKSMYQWVKDSFDHGFDPSARRSASVSSLGTRNTEIARRSFSQALITQVTFPELDSSSRALVNIDVTFSAPEVNDTKPSGTPVAAARQKAWLCSNFKFSIDGVETGRVATIDSFTWKCRTLDDGSLVLDMGDIGLTFDSDDVSSWSQWYDNLGSGASDERSGSLVMVGAAGGGILTVGLSNLGIYQLMPDTPLGGQPSGKMRAEMYCESASWDLATQKK